MSTPDSRVPEPERRKIRRAIEDLEAAYDDGRSPDLAALAPLGPFRVPYLIGLIPYDMRCRRKYLGDRAGAAVETYLAAFPELQSDPDGVAQLILEEHAAQREAAPAAGSAESTQYDPRSRFAYRDRFPDLWPRLFPYTDTSRLPEPGERIGEWLRVERQLGRGGMGVVFECSDERLKRRVAVKLLDPAGPRFADPVFRERFLREAESLARVDQPNVVKVYFAGLIAGAGCEVPYFVMECIDGVPLDRRLRPGEKVPPAETTRLARGVAAALRAVHAAGLVHRDVNPRNVMVRTDGTPVLLDLGLVRSLDAAVTLTETGVLMGTVAYMAPEQADGAAVDGRADLFALGCMLYRAATGARPFVGDKITEVLLQIKSFDPPPPDDDALGLPVGLGNLIARLMAKNPDHRPQTADAVLAELDAVERGQPLAPPLPPPAPAAPSTMTAAPARFKRRAAAAVVVVAIFATTAAVFLGRDWFAPGGGRSSDPSPGAPVAYRGQADAIVYRDKWVPLIHPDALPLKPGDHFKVTVRIEPAAYLYAFWVEPDGEASPLYPWAVDVGWGSRPATERRVTSLSLPNESDYEPDPAKPLTGVTAIVVFACPKPLAQSDEEVKAWFDGLPPINRAKGDTRAVVWFDDYAPARGDAARAPKVVGPIDPYERWHVALKKRVGSAVVFQTSVSFAQNDK